MRCFQIDDTINLMSFFREWQLKIHPYNKFSINTCTLREKLTGLKFGSSIPIGCMFAINAVKNAKETLKHLEEIRRVLFFSLFILSSKNGKNKIMCSNLEAL